MAKPLLQVEGLSVCLEEKGKPPFYPVRDVTFDLERSAITALVGLSGSGKSMLSLALLDLLPQNGRISAGTIHFNRDCFFEAGKSNRLPGLRGRNVSMIFQEPLAALNPVFTIGSQFSDVIVLDKGCGRAEARETARNWLERCGLANAAEVLGLYPHQLSGGMAQRVMIAMALSRRPQVLLADEPTTALDVSTQKRILSLLQQLQRELGFAILLVSHDLSLVGRLAGHVLVMDKGRIVEQGSFHGLVNNPQSALTERLVADYARRANRLGIIQQAVQ